MAFKVIDKRQKIICTKNSQVNQPEKKSIVNVACCIKVQHTGYTDWIALSRNDVRDNNYKTCNCTALFVSNSSDSLYSDFNGGKNVAYFVE